MNRMARRPIVGVMGGGEASSRTETLACDLGAAIAKNGWVLLNGGRASGVMDASAKGASEAGGLVVGVLPTRGTEGMSPHVHVPICTGLGDARNVVNVLSSDAVVALPGGAGTLSEVSLALKNGRSVVLLGFDPGPVLGHYYRTNLLHDAASVEDAVSLLKRILG